MEILMFLLTLAVVATAYVAAHMDLKDLEEEEHLKEAVQSKFENSDPTDLSNALRLLLEKHDDKFYVYREDNREFLAHGRDAEEVFDALNQRLGDDIPMIFSSDSIPLIKELLATSDVPVDDQSNNGEFTR